MKPLEFDQEPSEIVIIEGYIDNDFGPHEIQVSSLAKFAGILDGGQKRLLDAKVSIYDDQGVQVELLRKDTVRRDWRGSCPPGTGIPFPCPSGGFDFVNITTNYLTPSSFRGIPGRSYLIEVTLENSGKVYRSSFQKMPDPIPIDSLVFGFRTVADDDLIPRSGVDVFGIWNDPPNEENHYLWEFNGTYKIESYDICPAICCIYDNSDPFGERCWVIETDADPTYNLSEDRYFNGQQVFQKIGFIEDDGKRFSSDEVEAEKQYHCEAVQYAITKDAFEFYSRIGTLSLIDGEIFDPPPVRPIGNFTCISNPSEIVVGYFGPITKTSVGAFISRNILKERKFHGRCGDCRYSPYFNGQLEVPEVYR